MRCELEVPERKSHTPESSYKLSFCVVTSLSVLCVGSVCVCVCVCVCVQLMVEGLYVLSVLEKDPNRKKALLDKFTEVVVSNADHFQPG